MPSLADRVFKDNKGVQPSADNISKKTRGYVERSMTREYASFIEARTAAESVENARDIAKRRGYELGRVSKERPFFVTDKDMGMSSGIENACAFVWPGEAGAPLRIVITHIDSPCLRLTPQPVYFDIDALTQNFCPSFSVICEPYGGIRLEEWYGRDVSILGHRFDKDKRGRRREIPGVIKQKSVHVENGESRTYSGLRVDTGCRTLPELYHKFGVSDSMDFGKSRFYVVPHIETENLYIVGNEFVAYGQDDRAGAWAGIRAFERAASQRLVNTMVVLLLDREEIGGEDSSAGYRGVFEVVIKETLKALHNPDTYSRLDIPLDLNRNLMGGLPALVVDLDVGIGPLECQQYVNYDSIDVFNAAKPGWGFYISSGGSDWGESAPSPTHVSRVMNIMDRGLGRRAKDRYQVTGRNSTPDAESASGTFADILGKYLPCLVTGIAGVGLHSPRSECINKYDLFWLAQGIELYLREP